MNINGVSINRDEEGYLVTPEQWNKDIAVELAREENLELDDEYWSILMFMRRFYDEHQVSPDTRYVIRYLADELGYGKKARNYLFKIFPYGYVKQACKIAGMKHPRAWSTG